MSFTPEILIKEDVKIKFTLLQVKSNTVFIFNFLLFVALQFSIQPNLSAKLSKLRALN